VNYYNEYDRFPAAWLRELSKQDLILEGEVDERSICDVKARELSKYAQCHFFAGIGGWAYALRLAGWPDDREVWTGSCPCQPFSIAGKRKGTNDERHLWPAFRWLIAQYRPPVVFGEQVASKAGRQWLSGVRADLEAMGYVVGAADLCAAGVGAPHIRQRLFWVAYAKDGHGRGGERGAQAGAGQDEERGRRSASDGADSGVGQSINQRLEGFAGDGDGGNESGRDETYRVRPAASTGGDCGVENSERLRRRGRGDGVSRRESGTLQTKGSCSVGWSEYILIPCADGKARRIEPRTLPLVDGLPRGMVPSCDISRAYAENTAEERQGRIKGYGNAIIPGLAAVFIQSVMEVTGC